MAGVFFLVCGLIYLPFGIRLGVPGLPIGWLGLSCLVVGVAFVANRPGLMGKRASGTIAIPAVLVLGPFLVLTWLAWQVRRLRGEPCWNEVVPGVYLGRRATVGELPSSVGLVVDLTCETWEPAPLRRLGYRCLPTLDGQASEPEQFAQLASEVAASSADVFVHCMAGHGRSAALVVAVLIQRGLAENIEAAEALVRRARPKVELTEAQRNLLRMTCKSGISLEN